LRAVAGQGDTRTALILSQRPVPNTKKPAGNEPDRRIWEVEMLTHLFFLLLIMVVLGLRIKITIDRQ